MALLLVAGGLLGLPAAPAWSAPATQPVTVRIMSVECEHCRNEGLEDAGMSAPDFYAKITIGSDTFTTPRAPDDQTQVFLPQGWTMTRQVSTSLASVDISVQIWDFDPAPDPNGDDLADSSPRAGDATTRFKLDLVDGDVSGDLTSSNQCLLGNGEEDQPPVQVCFDVRPYSFEDSDGDSFTDYAEYRGLDFNDDGTIDLHLEQYADTRRRDLFVEIDWMKGEQPGQADLNAVQQVFNAAPVTNDLTGATGLALHVIPDEEVPWAESLRFDGDNSEFDALKWGASDKTCAHGGEDGHFGTAADRASPLCEQVLLFKRLHFRYGIFIHGLSPATVTDSNGKQRPNLTTGMAELDDRGSNDFVVSVGRLAANVDVNRYNGIGAVRQATLLHELGHTFGLGHGGRTDDGRLDSINCKPNYFSVMNYPLQFATASTLADDQQLDPNRPLDYQRVQPDTLVESNLDETKVPGVGGAGNRRVIWGGGPDNRWFHDPANGPLNWRVDFLPSPPNPPDTPNLEKSVNVDINRIPSFDGCADHSAGQTLLSHTDWDRLVYDFSSSRYFAEGSQGPYLQEISGDDLQRLLAADLNVTKTVDKADAVPGDQLTYTVKAGNKGPSTATAVSLTDTPPTGAAVTRDLPDLPAGQSNEQTFTYLVPCTVTDGAVLTNTAKVTGKDASGGAEPELLLGDDTATAKTTAHVPVLTLTKTATPSAHAGDPLTYTLTYRNTGSAPATGVVVTDTLPGDVYYSQALDQGTGPKPAEVVKGGDGTTTLRWKPGTVAPGATATISYTARTSLLTTGGTVVATRATLEYGGAGDCEYPGVTATAGSTVTEQPPGRDPRAQLAWALHQSDWTPDLLARVQATDQRYDGADGSTPDGALSKAEVGAAFTLPLLQPRLLRAELLTTYLNLSDRRINAATRIVSVPAGLLDLTTTGQAARYAQSALQAADALRETKVTVVLNEINLNLSERY
ncbi:DUF7507 domain-containing protein [Nonomuraea sp. CA-141351]|uniref:DUF7507 domain-containing protein n=1 Tax=Nonomuraea sp. CA-141351 TaxID=3239996 RepID=UPI003D9065B0